MVRYIVITVFFLACFTSMGQPEEYKGYFGVSAGISIPMADFASTSLDDENAGYANSGFTGFLSTNIHIKDFTGFTGLIGYGQNPYNEKAFVENYNDQYPDQEYDFTAGSYEVVNFLAGAFVSIPQGILDINLKGYIGFSVATMPATRSNSHRDPEYTLETEKSRGNAFTYGGGVNLMFYTNRNMAIIFDAIYLQGEPEFNAVEIRVYEHGQLTGLSAIDLKQKFQVVTLSAGIAFTF